MMDFTAQSRVLIRHDGTCQHFEAPVLYQHIKELIGASCLDVVSLDKRKLKMYVDDVGHGRNLPVNEVATALYHEVCRPGTTFQIVGNVFLMPHTDLL